PAEFKKTVQQFLGSAKPVSEGLQLDVAVLADNPSAVPVKAKVTLPITDEEWCEEIIVLAELNPSPLTCRLRFTADTGTAEAAVRVRLSQTQTIHAMARMKSGKVLVAKQAVTVAASGCGM
ncbi:MAG: thiosulfate oxidation carrier protein SoxY, partial [Comamonas sp.]